MRRHRILPLTIFLLPTAVFGQSADRHNPSEWKELSVKAGGYSVLLPDNADSPEYFDLQDAKGTSIAGHRFAGFEGDVMYAVDYSDLATNDRKALLEEWRAALQKERTYKSISMNGSPGVEFRRQGRKDSVTGRAYLVQDRLYVLFVLRQKNSSAPNNTERFLNSFKLISK